jgi:DNA-binding transcriptional ArsR family regulator
MENPKFILDYSNIFKLSNKFKVLSEESRLIILKSLQDGEKSVTEIVENTHFLQANVSRQLKILLENRIVCKRSEGKRHYFSICDKHILKICEIMCETQ